MTNYWGAMGKAFTDIGSTKNRIVSCYFVLKDGNIIATILYIGFLLPSVQNKVIILQLLNFIIILRSSPF